jgi:cullin 3
MCKHGEELYSAVEAVIASEVEGLGRSLGDVYPDDMLFLQELLARWQLHKKAASMSCDVLMYMEKHFVPANHKTPVYELALRLWRDSVVRSDNVLPRLIAEMRQEREGEDAAADLAGVAEMLKELGDEVYHQVMGAPAVAE